jgi:hypothetical protein
MSHQLARARFTPKPPHLRVIDQPSGLLFKQLIDC